MYIFDSERERERAQVGGVAGRGRSSLPTEQGARCGAWPQDPGIMTGAKGRGFNPLSHPGAPGIRFLKSLTSDSNLGLGLWTTDTTESGL